MKNIFQLIEASSEYSLFQMHKQIQDFFKQNSETFVNSVEFLKADKSVIRNIVTYNIFKPEEIFHSVYEWADHQNQKHF
uniref:BACK domain-containing protein n=1 Tax=Panagrolaimus sp. PS1159 TaxID=55785 RepID=A0AC35G394_9BILA